MLANRIVGLSPPMLLSCFISGLNPKIRCEVQAFQPVSLPQAMALAHLQEDKVNGCRKPSRSSFPLPHKHYFGPFRILECIGKIAYRLQLPQESRIHPMFHCLMLRPHHGPFELPTSSLPPEALHNQPVLELLTILDSRVDSSTSLPTRLVLVQWVGLPPEDSTWEKWEDVCSAHHLEDKVNFRGEGNVRTRNEGTPTERP